LIPFSFLEAVRGLDDWIVVSHEKPDGDTLGCGSAISAVLGSMGKRVCWIGRDPLPRLYSFLSESGIYSTAQPGEVRSSLGDGPVGWFFVDSSDITRAMDHLPRGPEDRVVNVDHHGDNGLFGDVNWVDPSFAATGEMLADLFKREGVRVSSPVATDLYVAMVTDTGFFRFSSVTPRTLETAAFLLSKGVDHSFVDDAINRSMDERILHLWGKALCRVRSAAGGAVLVSWLDQDDFVECGCDPSATEGLVNLIFSTPEGLMAALVTRSGGDLSRVSLRTRGGVSARAIAARFGGGGHERAAGFRLKESPEEGARMLLAELARDAVRLPSDR